MQRHGTKTTLRSPDCSLILVCSQGDAETFPVFPRFKATLKSCPFPPCLSLNLLDLTSSKARGNGQSAHLKRRPLSKSRGKKIHFIEIGTRVSQKLGLQALGTNFRIVSIAEVFPRVGEPPPPLLWASR